MLIEAADTRARHATNGVEITSGMPGQLLKISGPLGVRTSARVRAELFHALGSGSGDLVVDLSGAEVHDSTGLGVLVGAHHTAQRCGRRLVVGAASEQIERLLRITKLDRVMARSILRAVAG